MVCMFMLMQEEHAKASSHNIILLAVKQQQKNKNTLFAELTALSSKKPVFKQRIGESSFLSHVRGTACTLEGKYTWSLNSMNQN